MINLPPPAPAAARPAPPACRRARPASTIVQPESTRSSTSSTGPSRSASAAATSGGTLERVVQRPHPLGAVAPRIRRRRRGSRPACPRSGSRPIAAIRSASDCTSCGPPAGTHRDHRGRALAPSRRRRAPSALRTSTTAPVTSSGIGPSGDSGRDQRAQPRPPAQVGEPAHRAAGGDLLGRRDLALERYADRLHAGRPHLLRCDLDARTAEEGMRGRQRPRGHLGVEQRLGAGVAATAGLGLRVVEAPAQELHAAIGRAGVLDHGFLLCGPRLGHPPQPRGVVGPGLAGGEPAAARAPDRAVDVEHLEHQLEPRPAQIDQRLQGRRRQRAVRRADWRAPPAPAPRAGTRATRSTARSPRPPGRATAPPRRARPRDRPGRPAGNTRSVTAARPGARRSRGRACRSPCRARTSPPAP